MVKERSSWTIEGQIISAVSIDFRNQTDTNTVLFNFKKIDVYLLSPFDGVLQKPIKSRFRTSAVRIRAIGDREFEVGDTKAPLYTRFERQWISRRARAVNLGYSVKTFIEYAYQR